MIEARFFFDAGSGCLLWGEDGPWETGDLPVSEDLRRAVDTLVARFDTSLNWDYPPDPGPWSRAECARFNADARALLERLRVELGPEWMVEDRFKPL
ncbi:hypothetical protein [Hamadaea tsunoensis]|uniref:hypothetical protein n=1 Tax=Hamadaea tsunoensis TaxID=53368 RepID=UPI0004216746|nr:hypothetical protein [Hamadaea tsunoensis]